MMEPKPPPSRMARYSSYSASSLSLVAPPEKITMRRPLKADWTTWRMRSARVEMGTAAFSYAFFASACSMCDVGGVGDRVDARLTRLTDGGPARIRPHHGGEAVGLAFRDHLAALLVHGLRLGRAGVDGEAGGRAAEPQRVLDRARDGRERILLVVEHIVVVHLEDEGNVTRELRGARLEEAQRRRIGVASSFDGEPKVVGRIVAGRVDGEASRGTVLEALVHGQDDEAAGAGQAPVIHDPGKIGAGASVVAVIPGEDF